MIKFVNTKKTHNLRCNLFKIKRYLSHNGRKEMFYLWLYDVGHMVKEYSDSKRGNPLQPHGLLFPISSKGSFICILPQTG